MVHRRQLRSVVHGIESSDDNIDPWYIKTNQMILFIIISVGALECVVHGDNPVRLSDKPCNCGSFPKTLDLSNRTFPSKTLRRLIYDNRTRCLKINHDRLTTINCMDFATLPVNLTNLCMKDNSMVELTCDNGASAFGYITNLTVLDVRRNAFNFSGLESLFASISETTTIKKVYLSHNNLNQVYLRKLNVSFVSNLELLYAKNCSLKDLRDLFSRSPSTGYNMVYLDVSFNNISEESLVILNVTSFPVLKELILSNNPITYLNFDLICELPLVSLSISNLPLDNSVRTYKGINMSSLEILVISNTFIFDSADKDVFNYSLRLKHLDMSGILLDTWSDFDVRALFSPLVYLQWIDLSRSNISFISQGMFQTMCNVTYLSLSHNRISGWDSPCFTDVLPSLQKLDLSHNTIATINDTSFPEVFIKQLHKLKLHGNNFRCDCSTHWFRSWMRGHYWMLDALTHDNASRYLCKTPELLHGTPLVDFDPTYEECHGLSMAESVATVIIGLSFVFTMFVCLKGGNEEDDENKIY